MSQNEFAQGEQAHEHSRIKCKRCSAMSRLAHKILNVRTGGALCMYKCECGEQMWIERPQ